MLTERDLKREVLANITASNDTCCPDLTGKHFVPLQYSWCLSATGNVVLCGETPSPTIIPWDSAEAIILSCMIIWFFIGQPTNGICGVRPWLSLFFTCVFGNLVSKQLSIAHEWLKKYITKEKDDTGVLQPKYKWYHCIGLLGPKEGVYSSNNGQQIACRSQHDTAWLVVLFILFAVLLFIGEIGRAHV